MARLSRLFNLTMLSKCSPTTPKKHASSVWALPCSLATTWGIISYFLFLWVLRCFSSPGWLSFEWYDFIVPGCPIRKSPDYRLYAATRSLSQLTTSFIASQRLGIRHAPLFALKILNLLNLINYVLFPCINTFLQKNCFPNMSKNLSWIPSIKYLVSGWCDVEGVEPFILPVQLHLTLLLSVTDISLLKRKSGGYRSRTDDPLRARQVL